MKKGRGRLPGQTFAATTEVFKPSVLEPKNLKPSVGQEFEDA
jgi:hypothetical protein